MDIQMPSPETLKLIMEHADWFAREHEPLLAAISPEARRRAIATAMFRQLRAGKSSQ